MLDRLDHAGTAGEPGHAGGESADPGQDQTVGVGDHVGVVGHRDMAGETGLAGRPLDRLFDGAQIPGPVVDDRQRFSHGEASRA